MGSDRKLKAQSEHVKVSNSAVTTVNHLHSTADSLEAEGNVVITMDADLQDSPDEIPELYRMITKDGYDLVSGWKQRDMILFQNTAHQVV